MNLKIAALIINHLQVMRLQGFNARISIRGILTPTLSLRERAQLRATGVSLAG